MTTPPNHRPSVDAGIVLRFQVGHHSPGAPEAARSGMLQL